jgi:hypothetical protein
LFKLTNILKFFIIIYLSLDNNVWDKNDDFNLKKII